VVGAKISRRAFGLGLGLIAVARPALTETVVDLTWQDLLPKGEVVLPPELQGLIDHDGPSMEGRQPMSTGVRTDWNGASVRLSGFVLPLDYQGTGVTAFMLVPYVGACIHVPPPPANQLVLVTTETPYEVDGLFSAVTVTGMFGTASTSTQLADIGYALSAEDIRAFR
jgi:hypothetical protein